MGSTSFGRELVKLAAMATKQKRKRRSPAAYAAAVAPLAAAQSIGEIPKGVLEKSIDQAVQGKRLTAKSVFRLGGAKAGGRFGAALATTPLFVSGIKDIRDAKSKRERRKGMGKVLASGVGYGAIKGGLETALDKGLNKSTLKAIRGAVGARSVLGATGGVLVAREIAKSMRPAKKGRKKSIGERARPYAMGGALSAAEGGLERTLASGLKTKKLRRAAVAGAVSRGVAGVAGTALLKGVARMGAKEKRSSEMMPVDLGPRPYETYQQVSSYAKTAPTDALWYQMERTTSRGDGTPTRRAVFTALQEELTRRGERPPVSGRQASAAKIAPPTAPGPTLMDAASVAAVVAAPELIWRWGVEKLPQSDQDVLLREAMDRMIVAKGIHRMREGKDVWGAVKESATFLDEGKRPVIQLAKNAPAEAAAHELGHATAGVLRRKTIGSQLAMDAHTMAKIPAILLPLLALQGMGDTSFTTPHDLEARARFSDNVGTVTRLLMAPHLTEEALASVSGARYLQAAGVTRKEAIKRMIRVGGPAWLTYAAPALAAPVASRILRRKARQARETS